MDNNNKPIICDSILTKTAFSVNLIEYERGWGSKVDDTIIFLDANEAYKYVEEFNAKNTEDKVPDWYMIAEKPIDVKLSVESYEIIDKTAEKYMSERTLRDILMVKNKTEEKKQTKRICACCSQELIVPINGLPDWYVFELSTTNISTSVIVNEKCIEILPPFIGTKHFCNKKCLIDFLNKLK